MRKYIARIFLQIMDLIPSNIKSVCRTCLSIKGEMKPLFTVQISDSSSVRTVDFIQKITSVKVVEGDGLSEYICSNCADMLCKAYSFAQSCISADRSLRLEQKRLILRNIQNEILVDELSWAEETCSSSEPVIEQHDSEIKSDECTNKDDFQNGSNGSFKLQAINNIACDDFEVCKNEEVEAPDYIAEELICEDSERHRCLQCQEYFISKEQLQDHQQSHISKGYRCSECSKMYIRRTHLKVHMRSHVRSEDKQYLCTICGKKFVFLYLLKQHSYKHTQEKPYPCTKCSKGCLTAESLRRHMKVHDENYKKKHYSCPVCCKEFPYPSFLAEHMKNHTGEKPFLCSVCGKGFRQNGALAYHMQSHTGCKPFKCNICHSTFSSKGVLKVHIRRHTNERPYICDLCGMAFKQSSDMKSHCRTHTGEKPVLCPVCGKRLSTTGQLTVHLRSHTGEKPFSCDICQKGFTTRTMLVKHLRIHTGERPYVCCICNRAFNQSSTLKTHMITHNRKKVVVLENGSDGTGTEALVLNETWSSNDELVKNEGLIVFNA